MMRPRRLRNPYTAQGELHALLEGWRFDNIEMLEHRLGQLKALAVHVHIWQYQWDVIDHMRRRLTALKKEAVPTKEVKHA